RTRHGRPRAPVSFLPQPHRSPVTAMMMPAAPVMPTMPVSISADPARAVVGPDYSTAVMIVVGVISGVVAAIEETAMMEVGEASATAMMEAHAAAVPAATMPASTTVETVKAAATKAAPMKTTVAAAMTT